MSSAYRSAHGHHQYAVFKRFVNTVSPKQCVDNNVPPVHGVCCFARHMFYGDPLKIFPREVQHPAPSNNRGLVLFAARRDGNQV